MPSLSGHCLCGKIRISGTVEIKGIPNCHCTECRRATGATFATMLFVTDSAIKIVGKPKIFRHKSDKGSIMEKHFCGHCGSQVFGRNSNRPGIMSLRAGILDQIEHIEPTVNVYLDSKVPSTLINQILPGFSKMPG